ncbi:hypothetical protein [Emcibacter sp. SYSU 3D8]|uniref:hypothetical protein n=1 Tax=Emcibacter sp. SYSU 3D8 TaxID=3133969 RepID=UPI0031FE966A
MKVRTRAAEFVTHYEGNWCSIGVHRDGRGQVLLAFPDPDGRIISEAATVPQVWDFLEGVERLDREELDRWVMGHLPGNAERG